MKTIAAIAVVLAFALTTGTAAAAPSMLVEHGSAVLVWLDAHPRAGTARSRARVEGRFRAKVWAGLRLAGVAWIDRRTGDVSARSPFGCIHGNEAGWHGDSNPKYDGGLQMDYSFQTTYGREFARRWGAADQWPVWAQVVAGYRAWRTRGWNPWPNTARACGLL